MKKASRSLVRACCVVVTLCMLVTLCACGDTAETSSTAPQANPASDFVYEVNGTGDGIIITKYVGTSKQVVIPDKIDGLPVVTLTHKKDQAHLTAESFSLRSSFPIRSQKSALMRLRTALC